LGDVLRIGPIPEHAERQSQQRRLVGVHESFKGINVAVLCAENERGDALGRAIPVRTHSPPRRRSIFLPQSAVSLTNHTSRMAGETAPRKNFEKLRDESARGPSV